jgi:quercetin dioxygenase-like cupin family protein
MQTQMEPRIAGPETGERLSVLGVRIRMLATGDETAGACSFFEVVIPPGAGVPPHIHTREDEHLFILEGRCELYVGDQRRVAGPGASTIMPRGVPHGFRNLGTAPARVLVVATPGGFEEFFRAMQAVSPGAPDAPLLPRVREVCAEFGMTLV